MTRSGPKLQADSAELEALAIGDCAVRKAHIGGGSVDDGGAGGCRELQVAGQEVGVHVGLDHVFDTQSCRVCVVEVLPDVSPRVNHDGPPSGLVPDQIGGLRQAVEVVLNESHRRPLPLTSRSA